MTIRLTEQEKARLTEFNDAHINSQSAEFIDPNESAEFHEGVATGMLLASDMLREHRKNKIAPMTISAIRAIAGCFLRQASKHNQGH